MALPSSWLDKACALPGQLLVQRARSGYSWQGIIELPDNFTHGTKNANARVHDIGNIMVGGLPTITHFNIGDRVFLAAGVARMISFEEAESADPHWEPKLYACYPGEIMGVFLEGQDEEVSLEPHPLGQPREASPAELQAEDRAEETS